MKCYLHNKNPEAFDMLPGFCLLSYVSVAYACGIIHYLLRKITDVIGCKLEDRPGGLARIVKVISNIGVNMEYMYAFLTKTDSAYLVIRVEDNGAVEAALRARGIPLLQEEDVTAL